MTEKQIARAFSCVPHLLFELSADGRGMLADVMQAMLEIGMQEGREECVPLGDSADASDAYLKKSAF